MPKLTWVEKKVINHHHEVPFRVLEHKYNFEASDANSHGNKIIHGDNPEALKLLLSEYEGKVKFVYIDSPYITRNEASTVRVLPMLHSRVNNSILAEKL